MPGGTMADSVRVIGHLIHNAIMTCMVDQRLPGELRPVGERLLRVYQSLWACDLEYGRLRKHDEGASTVDQALNLCQTSARDLEELILRSVATTIDASPTTASTTTTTASAWAILERLSTADRLIQQITNALQSVPHRRPPQGKHQSERSRAASPPNTAVGTAYSAKFYSSGSAAQYNSVQESTGTQVITNNHRGDRVRNNRGDIRDLPFERPNLGPGMVA